MSLTRKRLIVPMTLAAAASVVALAAVPASAAPFTKINISSSAIPASANCVYVTDNTAGWITSAHKFSAGSNVSITGHSVGAGDSVVFEWHSKSCAASGGSDLIRNDFRTAPGTGGDVWNVH